MDSSALSNRKMDWSVDLHMSGAYVTQVWALFGLKGALHICALYLDIFCQSEGFLFLDLVLNLLIDSLAWNLWKSTHWFFGLLFLVAGESQNNISGCLL